MNKEDLYRTEFLNLTALCKQIEKSLSNLDVDFLLHKDEKLVAAIYSVNMRDINLLEQSAQDSSFAIESAKDKAASEILKTIKKIPQLKIKSDIKGQALLVSLNKLLNYKLANMQNVIQLKVAESIPHIENALSSNQTLKRQIVNSID